MKDGWTVYWCPKGFTQHSKSHGTHFSKLYFLRSKQSFKQQLISFMSSLAKSQILTTCNSTARIPERIKLITNWWLSWEVSMLWCSWIIAENPRGWGVKKKKKTVIKVHLQLDFLHCGTCHIDICTVFLCKVVNTHENGYTVGRSSCVPLTMPSDEVVDWCLTSFDSFLMAFFELANQGVRILRGRLVKFNFCSPTVINSASSRILTFWSCLFLLVRTQQCFNILDG